MSRQEFKDLVFYEIYPTSFYDSNNDGIGDLKGIELKLDYVKELGCNAIWLNPFFKSPFFDGGYDVEDFFDVDPRFGNIEDFKSLIKTAHEKGIKIILDLVAGHASIKNKEFQKSTEPKRNEYSDLFVWNDSVWEWNPNFRLMAGIYQRSGAFLVNFFAHQPAFNYGFNIIDRPWQMSYEDPRTYQAREYMLKVMRHWLGLGADGFRVDMADSLVKNDNEKDATIKVWKCMFSIIRKEYPNAYFVSEWSNPSRALEAGFDADFVLDHWDNFYHHMVRSNENTRGKSLLNGSDDFEYVIKDMKYRFEEANKHDAYIALISGNHDTPRIADSLDLNRLKMFYLYQLSMPGTPFIYYGDELMMKTMPLDSKDGGYQRTGVRIPMVWNNQDKYHGFSNTKGETYLPFYDVNKVSVEDAIKDEESLYNFIKRLIALRKENSGLRTSNLAIKEDKKVIEITRGDNLKVVLNLSNNDYKVEGNILIASQDVKDNLLPSFSGAIIKQ
ncbi:MAG: glycosylase [Bacilli bacterium]|nr:glycosylase [Bacilli bacterium]